MAIVLVEGEKIGEICDYLCDCPEDAIWHRALGDIFWAGVRAGLKAKSVKDIEVTEISDPY